MGKKRASKMDIDDVAPTQQGEQTAGPVKDGAEDDTPGLTGKDKKKAEWLARQQLKAKVGAIKKERCGPVARHMRYTPKPYSCNRGSTIHWRGVPLAGAAGSEPFESRACCC